MTDLPESFADHPPTVTEIRGNKARDCSIWTPRDALINALRDLDSGKPCTALVIAWAGAGEDGTPRTTYYQASPSPWLALGLIERVKFMMQEKD